MSEITEEQVQKAAELATGAKEKVDPLDNEDINNTAKVFMDSLPRVKALASNMKGHALSRVFNAVMEFPLSDNYPKFRSKAENELFIMSLSLLLAKNKMMAAVSASQAEMQNIANNAINDAAKAVSEQTKQEDTNV